MNLNHLHYLEDMMSHILDPVIISVMFCLSCIFVVTSLRMWLLCLLGWPNWKDSCPGVVPGFWCFRSHSTFSRHERLQVHCCCEQRCRCPNISGDDLNSLEVLSRFILYKMHSFLKEFSIFSKIQKSKPFLRPPLRKRKRGKRSWNMNQIVF